MNSDQNVSEVKKVVAFDLDRTMFFCKDKFANPIWAKQMVAPLYLRDQGSVGDDVGSVCELNPVAWSLLQSLKDMEHVCCFVSSGRYFGISEQFQPSLGILKMFGLLHLFDPSLSVLEYKTFEKSQHFLKHPNHSFMLIDDNPTVRREAEQANNCVAVDISETHLSLRVIKWLEI